VGGSGHGRGWGWVGVCELVDAGECGVVGVGEQKWAKVPSGCG